MVAVTITNNETRLGDLRFTQEVYHKQLTFGQNTFITPSGEHNISARWQFTSITNEEVNFIESTLKPAWFNAQVIRMNLPREIYDYAGPSGIDLVTSGSHTAGVDSVTLNVSGFPGTFPNSDTVYPGCKMNIGNDSSIFTVKSYDSDTGVAEFYPSLSVSAPTGSSVEVENPYYYSHILGGRGLRTQTIPGAYNYNRVQISTREYRGDITDV